MKTIKIRIFVIFLTWIAPIQKLNSFAFGKSIKDVPNYFCGAIKQLEQFEKFANMLIISEGVVEGSTNVSTLAIDFMIMGHMRNKPGWIGKNGKQELEKNMTGQFEKLYEEFQQLKNILENEMNSTIEVDEFPKMVEIMADLPVVKRIRSKIEKWNAHIDNVPQFIERLLEESQDFDFKNLIQFQLHRDLVSAPNSKSMVSDILSVFQFFDNRSDLLNFNFLKYNESCPKGLIEGIDSFLEFQKLMQQPETEVIKRTVDYLLNLYDTYSETMQQKFISIDNILNDVNMLLKNGIEKITEDDAKVYGNMIETLKGINTEKLKSMDSFLKLMLNFYESFFKQMNSTDSSFVNSRFKSYLGFENDIGMFEKMADSLDPNHEFPSQFSNVRLNSRLKFVKQLTATLHLFSELSNVLRLFDNISKIKSSVVQMAENIPSDSIENVSHLKEHLSKMKEKEVISAIFADLNKDFPQFHIVERFAKLFQNGTKESNAFRKYLVHSTYLFKMGEFLSKYTVRDLARRKGRICENDDFREIASKIADYPDKLYNFREFFEPIETSSKPDDIPENTASSNLTENVLELSAKWESMNQTLSERKEEVAKIDRQLSQFKSDSNPFDNITEKKVLIEKTKKLLKLITNLTNIDLKFDQVPFEKMPKLIAGTPFGSEILDNLHNGIHSYQSLVDGLILTGNLKQEIEKMKSEDLKLGGKVEKLLNGVEVIEVVTDVNHSNPFEYLQTMPSLIEHLEKAADWLRWKSGRIVKIKKDLGDLKGNVTNSTTFSSSAVGKLHHFVSQLNEETENGIRRLENGIRTIFEELSYFETTQTPTIPKTLDLTTTLLDTTEIFEKTTTWPSTVTPVTAHLVGIQVEATTEETAEDPILKTLLHTFFILLVLLLLMLLVPHAFYFYKEHKKVGNQGKDLKVNGNNAQRADDNGKDLEKNSI